jgi:hypothetical protein
LSVSSSTGCKHKLPLLRSSARICMNPGDATQSLAVILSSWLPRTLFTLLL